MALDELDFSPQAPPLRLEGGAIRVGGTRITLELLVDDYENGMTPEDMVRAYDVLTLPDAYSAIAYYLAHRDEVRAYVKRREEETAAIRTRLEGNGPKLTRTELLARRAAMNANHASTGQ